MASGLRGLRLAIPVRPLRLLCHRPSRLPWLAIRHADKNHYLTDVQRDLLTNLCHAEHATYYFLEGWNHGGKWLASDYHMAGWLVRHTLTTHNDVTTTMYQRANLGLVDVYHAIQSGKDANSNQDRKSGSRGAQREQLASLLRPLARVLARAARGAFATAPAAAARRSRGTATASTWAPPS